VIWVFDDDEEAGVGDLSQCLSTATNRFLCESGEGDKIRDMGKGRRNSIRAPLRKFVCGLSLFSPQNDDLFQPGSGLRADFVTGS